jgi:type II secretory pathway component PulK
MNLQSTSALFLLRRRRLQRQRGSALMLVFGLISILMYLIFTTMRVVVNDIQFTVSQRKAFRGRCLAEMGIAVAMNPVTKKTDAALLNRFLSEDGYESFKAEIRGEGGKLNINALLNPANPQKDLLKHLFEHWGMVDEDERVMLVDTLIDWIDSDDGHLEHGMEKDDYQDMGISGYPFDRPFNSLDELLLVPGWDTLAALRPNWRDYITIYSQGRLDVNEAPPELLEVVCDARAETVQEFVESRYGPDNAKDTPDDVRYSVQDAMALMDAGSGKWGDTADVISARLTDNDTTTRIESTGTVGDFRKRIIIVVRSRQGQPQILTREEIPLF